MAKLSARGRTELARVVRDRELTNASAARERVTLAFMSDGCVLRKLDVWFKPLEALGEAPLGNGKGRLYSYGWKQWKKYSQADLEATIKPFLDRGYVRES